MILYEQAGKEYKQLNWYLLKTASKLMFWQNLCVCFPVWRKLSYTLHDTCEINLRKKLQL